MFGVHNYLGATCWIILEFNGEEYAYAGKRPEASARIRTCTPCKTSTIQTIEQFLL